MAINAEIMALNIISTIDAQQRSKVKAATSVAAKNHNVTRAVNAQVYQSSQANASSGQRAGNVVTAGRV